MKSLTDGRSTRWQQHRDLRRRELLRAVRHVVDEHGDELSMEQISEYSGTTKSVLYRYFTDRAGLQAAMGEWAMDVISKSLDDATAASAQDALAEMIHAFVALAAESPILRYRSQPLRPHRDRWLLQFHRRPSGRAARSRRITGAAVGSGCNWLRARCNRKLADRPQPPR